MILKVLTACAYRIAHKFVCEFRINKDDYEKNYLSGGSRSFRSKLQ